MGEDKIEQHVEVTGNAQTGDITLIGKIENVIKVIRQPALWQDAVWGFLTRNWIFVFSCLLVQGLVLLVYLRYKNLFLIPALACLVLELLVTIVVWGVNLAIQRNISRRSLLVTSLVFVSSLGLIGWVSIPIINPQTFPTEKFGIAVAMFGEGADYKLTNNAREISGQIYEGLCEELRQKLGSDEQNDPCGDLTSSSSNILIQQIGVIPDSDTAEWYSHRIDADIVVWGQVLTSGQGTTTIRFQIDETLDKAVNPEFPVVMPVTSNFTEVMIKELDYESDPVKLKKAISGQTTYMSSFALGLFAYLQRDFPGAVGYFEIAKGTTDNAGSTNVNPKSKALLYLYLGRSYNGMSLLSKGQPILLSARDLNPEEPAILISLALGYGSLGQTEERDKCLQEAFNAIRDWLSIHTTDSGAALYDRGVIYQIWKQYDDAVIDLETVIENDPGYYVAYLNLAQSYSELGDYQNAVETLNKAVTLSSTSKANPAWAHLNLAIIHEKYGNLDAARTEYQNAVLSSPDSSGMYAAYGLFLEKQNETNGALAVFNMMVETAWDKGWAYGTLADFQMRNGFTDDAAGNFSKAIHYKPEDELLHTKLAQAHAKSGNIEGAKTEFQRAITLPSVSYYSFAEYAGFLYQQGDQVHAVEMYLKALEIRPEEPAILLNLGQTYQTMNEPEKAIEIYRHIVSRADIFFETDIQDARRRLQDLGVAP